MDVDGQGVPGMAPALFIDAAPLVVYAVCGGQLSLSRRGLLQTFGRVARCYTIGFALHLCVGAVGGRVPGLVVGGHRTSERRASGATSPCLARE